MKAVFAFLLCLLFSASGLAESKSGFLRLKAKIDYGTEKIVAEQFLDNNAKLMVIGEKNIRVWDTVSGKLLESFPHEIAASKDPQWLDAFFSTDERRVLIFDPRKSCLKEKDKGLTAVVYDLSTGKKIVALEHPEAVVCNVLGGQNSDTLATLDRQSKPGESQISFWNTKDFSHQRSVFVPNYIWHHLTRGGRYFLVGVGNYRKHLGLRLGPGEGQEVQVFDTQTGAVRKLTAGGRTFRLDGFLMTYVSPDSKFLAAITDRTGLVWDIEKGGEPKFEIVPESPKNRVWLYGYLQNGKYLHTSQAGNAKFYQTDTGELVAELPKPAQWELNAEKVLITPDEKYAVRQECGSAKVFDLKTNTELYRFKYDCVNHSTHDPHDPSYWAHQGSYKSDAELAFDSSGEMLFEFRDSIVNIRRTKSGEILQTISNKEARDVKYWNAVRKQVGDHFLVRNGDTNSFLIWQVNKN